MKTLKVKKNEFKKALNKLCHKHNVVIHDSFAIVYTRGKYWDVSHIKVNTHPYKSLSDIGMKLLHKQLMKKHIAIPATLSQVLMAYNITRREYERTKRRILRRVTK